MRLLLDTHTFIWWVEGDKRLSRAALLLLKQPDHEIYVSAVSAWEIATKVRMGKLKFPAPMIEDFGATANKIGCVPLPVTLAHGAKGGLLPGAHRDPFDRLLAAQSVIEKLTLLTCDEAFTEFGVATYW